MWTAAQKVTPGGSIEFYDADGESAREVSR
jgi:hypothetical protein